jgi:hypothetical protein
MRSEGEAMEYPIEGLKAAAARAGYDWREVVRKKIAYAEYSGDFALAKVLRACLD